MQIWAPISLRKTSSFVSPAELSLIRLPKDNGNAQIKVNEKCSRTDMNCRQSKGDRKMLFQSPKVHTDVRRLHNLSPAE